MTTTNINTGVNSLPAKVVAALNADNLNVIRVYSYSSTYWNGEQTAAFIIIAETTESRLLLLSCTEAVPCLALVFTTDDRRKSFPADELDTLIKRAESLAGITETTPTTPETETTTNTETAMNTTDTNNNNVTTEITNELNARKDKSAWNKAVTAYALELVETLDNWDKQPESVAKLREMMLNGASDWNAYSWGGLSLIYNQDIAGRCCTPSELKRVTTKNGLRDMANAREHWLDVQARALYQAANLVCNIAAKYFNA